MGRRRNDTLAEANRALAEMKAGKIRGAEVLRIA
jgi:hypothetical protein